MKKTLAIIFAAMLMVTAFAGCGKKDDTKNPDSSNPSSSDNQSTDTGAKSEGLASVIDDIYAKKPVELMLNTTKVDIADADALKAYTGLSDASKIAEVAASEPMMSSQAYSLVLVKVKDKADTEAVAKEMLEGVNPAKWVCVQADDLKVVATGDTVMLIMLQSDFADTVTADQIVDAFKSVNGGKLDVELKK